MSICLCVVFGWQITPTFAQNDLSIQVIEAHKKHVYMDNTLRSIAPTLKSSFKKLKSFKLLKSVSIPLVKYKKTTIKLPKGLKMNVSIKDVSKELIRIMLHIPRKKSRLKINAKPKELFFQAMKWKGKVYILAFKSFV